MRAWMVIALLCAELVACRSHPSRVTATKVDSELLRALVVLATSREPTATELVETRRRLEQGQLTVSRFIDQLVSSQEFSSTVAPLIILRHLLNQSAAAVPKGFVLSKTDGPRPFYYLYQPCAEAETVEVRAWWTIVDGKSETVRICPDSYRPEQWTVPAPAGEPEIACLSEMAQIQSEGQRCGCGPDLLRCFDSQDRKGQIAQSLRDEIRASVAHVVTNNLPLEQIFTTNETFRDRNAQFLLQSYVAETTRQPLSDAALQELATWPTDGKWAPRTDLAPGQNAGILTAPQIVFFQLDRRQRMTAIYDALWCADAKSVGATPESMLSIVGADLQIKGDGWRELAARPVCTTCHARLDYGFQFFWGFPNANLHAYFMPGLQQTGRGPLYANDIDDPRGEADLTPAGFAHLAVAQPEFRHCMARDFAEFVLGNQVTPEHIATLETAMRPNVTPGRELMRAALQMLVAEWPTRSPSVAIVPSPVTSASSEQIAVSPEIRGLLETHCLDCHDHQPDRPDLSAPALDRKTLVRALDAMAFGQMPLDAPLPEPERARFAEQLISTLWTGADADIPRAFYIDRDRALPAFRPEIAFALIHRAVGTENRSSWRMMENSVRPGLQQITPGFAAVTSLAAIEACRKTNKTRADIDRCILGAMRLPNLSPRAK